MSPKSGEKDGIVYALFAEEGEQYRQAEVASWLAGVCTAYEVRVAISVLNDTRLIENQIRLNTWANWR